MLHSLFGRSLNAFFLSLRQKTTLFDSRPHLIWLFCISAGVLGSILINFASPLIALILVLVALTASFIAQANDIETTPMHIPHLAVRQMIMAIFIFMISIGQETAGSFILLTYIGLFVSAQGLHAIKTKQHDFDKGRPFYHPSSVISDYEIIVFMILVGLVPNESFSAVATLFGIACWITIVSRFYDVFKELD